jgi:hypothetical protein
VFAKASVHSKTLLWYGFDNLRQQAKIHNNIENFSQTSGVSIRTYDIWLTGMSQSGCPINPGVPGCGLAAANMKAESLDLIDTMLYSMRDIYSHAVFNNLDASIKISNIKYS